MDVFGMAKRVIRATGLRPTAGALLRAYARLRPHHVCVRKGIRYDLDLSEVIDFGIYLGGWEPNTVAFLEECVRPDDVVVEVGANVGAHTLTLARLAGPKGKVYAFEPTQYALTKLERNLSINPDLSQRVDVRANMVTNGEHAMPIRTIKSSWQLASAPKALERVSATAVSLDDFAADAALSRVDLLKIDVDGYDYKVLQGAQRILARFRPVVFVELCEYSLNAQNDSIRDIFRLMDSLGYLRSLEDGQPVHDVTDVLNIVGDSTSVNAIFRPAAN